MNAHSQQCTLARGRATRRTASVRCAGPTTMSTLASGKTTRCETVQTLCRPILMPTIQNSHPFMHCLLPVSMDAHGPTRWLPNAGGAMVVSNTRMATPTWASLWQTTKKDTVCAAMKACVLRYIHDGAMCRFA
jgi:hypothetical protein